jgi:hypothetical protein
MGEWERGRGFDQVISNPVASELCSASLRARDLASRALKLALISSKYIIPMQPETI